MTNIISAMDQIPEYKRNLQVFNNPRLEQPWIGDQAIRRTLWITKESRCNV
jgi:hypothetical protein